MALMMLEITYKTGDTTTETLKYNSPADFVANQQLEVEDTESYWKLVKVTVDGKKITPVPETINDLYTYFENEKK